MTEKKVTMESLRRLVETTRADWLRDEVDPDKLASHVLEELDAALDRLVFKDLGVQKNHWDEWGLKHDSVLREPVDEAAKTVAASFVDRIEEALKKVKLPAIAKLKGIAKEAMQVALVELIQQKAIDQARVEYEKIRESLGLEALDPVEDKDLLEGIGEKIGEKLWEATSDE